ncbi:MAG TPA: UbiA family prenyltransferase [Candidatus Thermoplasmatota archaeon]|nr:UbiA family prenyltransferase [Candidatus Thermoplasmatota archaeon]
MEPRPSPNLGELLLYLWRLSRPETWHVSWVPMYVGWVLASREIVPGFELWADFWAGAAETGATSAEFTATLAVWWRLARPLVLASLAMGPLVWTATLLINDVHDLPSDRANPRKARSPLVQGLVSLGWAHAAAYVAAGLALAVALLVHLTFAALLAAALVLAWLYSAPPVRLKTRPGADVLVNAVGVGGLAAFAGWSLARPLSEAPWEFLPQGLLVAAAVYVPTTLVDHDADLAAGYSTFATVLGRRAAYRVGLACWIAANLGALLLSYLDLILPRAMFPLLVIFVPLLVYQYHWFIGRARDGVEMVKGVVLCSLTFLAVNLVFALMYTGLWVA